MNKKILVFFVGIAAALIGGAYFYYSEYNKVALPSFINAHITTYKTDKKYIIKKAGQIIDSADTLEEAKEKAKQVERYVIINTYNNEWVESDLQPYFIFSKNAIHDFKNFYDAYIYAKENDYTAIYYKTNKKIVWKADIKAADTKLNVPLIQQYPELPRGCEVTSLAMLLNYRNISVDKMTLAKEIKRDTTEYSRDKNGRIYYGNPYDGFVGDMYNARKNGYGVYHGPIAELAQKYCPDQTIDLTGIDFDDLLVFVQQGAPIWVVTNSTYASLSDDFFEIWHTPTGIVKITNKMHAVVITGFTEDTIYINDPLYSQKNRAVNRERFKEAWEQMGNQAVTIVE